MGVLYARAVDPLVGQVVDQRYAIEAPLGRGGMGVVYRARHVHLGEPVALKALLPERARDPQAARRFAREAKSAFRLDHEHIVRVTDFGATDAGLLYMVMELAPGRTLGQVLDDDGPLAPRRVLGIAAQIASALAHAHGRGIVHRDLKIDNVMVADRDGQRDFVKVLDFGLAKVIDADAQTGGTMLSMSPLTAQGTTFGTPEYMSPEQAMGAALTGKSDIYSLGVCLYELLTGALPFSAEPATAVLAMHVAEKPVPVTARRPDLAIPEAVSDLVLACLAKEPENRPDATALVDRCATLAQTVTTAPRVSPAVASSATIDLTGDAEAAIGRAAFTTSTDEVPIRPRGRWLLWALAVAVVGAVALALFSLVGAKPEAAGADRPLAAAPSPVPASGRATELGPEPEPEPESDPETETGSKPDLGSDPDPESETDPGPTQRAHPAAARAADSRHPRTETGNRRQTKLERHLAAAEAARKNHQRLQQLAEADAALRLAPKNRRAAFLVGDALIASGDLSRGCRFLKRALPHARARDLYRTRCGN